MELGSSDSSLASSHNELSRKLLGSEKSSIFSPVFTTLNTKEGLIHDDLRCVMDVAAVPLVRSQSELGSDRNDVCKQSKWKKVCFHSDWPEADIQTSEPPDSDFCRPLNELYGKYGLKWFLPAM